MGEEEEENEKEAGEEEEGESERGERCASRSWRNRRKGSLGLDGPGVGWENGGLRSRTGLKRRKRRRKRRRSWWGQLVSRR